MMKNKLFFLSILTFLLYPCALTQIPSTPLSRAEYAKVTPHTQMLQYLHDLCAVYPRFTYENIGASVQGREIPMIHLQPAGSGQKIKVLLFCQQHGNEPSGKEAALALLHAIASGAEDKILSHLDLFIIPCINPDGNEAGKRANANGEDLNRNHLVVSQPEVAALHSVYARINPEVTLDVHEFSAYRKEFREAGYFRSVDEQFGAPTNLNVSPEMRKYALEALFPFLESSLKKKGIVFSNYLKMNEPADTVRPSTTSIDDGRQSFAILNRFSFILEGKNGRGMNDELKRRSAGQLSAIESFLEFVNEQSTEISKLVENGSKKLIARREPVIMKMDYLYSGEKISLPVRTVSGADSTALFAIAPVVTPLESVDRPIAYVIPKTQKGLIELLKRHSVHSTTVLQPKKQLVEIYSIIEVKSHWMENKPTKIATTKTRKEEIKLNEGDVIVPMNQIYGTMIAIALEPASMWGIVQYDEYSSLCTAGNDYPIFRIVTNESRTQ